MTREELKNYLDKIAEEYSRDREKLKESYEQKMRDVCVPYACEHARFKEGNIICCENGIYKIQKIGARVDIKGGDAYPVYKCVELTKKLEIKKDNPADGRWIVDHNKEIKLYQK